MYTVIETPTFTEDAQELWFEEDRGALLVNYAKSIRGAIPAHLLISA